jgi:hypothetical protein
MRAGFFNDFEKKTAFRKMETAIAKLPVRSNVLRKSNCNLRIFPRTINRQKLAWIHEDPAYFHIR